MSHSRRAARYLRQSKDVEQGIDRQQERTLALVTARGWTDAGPYIDNDVSASKERGPGTAWDRMLKDAEAGLIDVVIGVDLDRLLRSTRDLNTLIDAGLQVVTVDGEIDLSTADGEFRATMLTGIARFEVRRKSERQVRANESNADKGIAHSARRLLGFPGKGVPEKTVERERDVVRALFDGFDRGESIVGLSRAHGIGPSSIRKLLLNQRYAGRRTYHGKVVATGNWDAIIDPAIFDRVTARLMDPQRRTNKIGTARRMLGSGLYECAECSASLATNGQGRIASGGGDGSHYRCRDCGMTRSGTAVDDYVEAVLLAKLRQPEAIAAMMPTTDTTALVEEAATITSKQEGLARMFASGIFTEDQVKAAGVPLRERLTAIHEEIASATVPAVLAGLEGTVAEEWDGLSLARRRAILDAFLTVRLHRAPKGVRVFDPDTVEFIWRS